MLVLFPSWSNSWLLCFHRWRPWRKHEICVFRWEQTKNSNMARHFRHVVVVRNRQRITTCDQGWLNIDASTLIYSASRRNGGHGMWLVEERCSIESLGLRVYTLRAATSVCITIWKKEKVCLVRGCLRFPFLWLLRCPQLPVSVCQSGGTSESQTAARLQPKRTGHCRGNRNSPLQELLWNMLAGNQTGQRWASFSTSRLSATCFKLKSFIAITAAMIY